MMRAAKIVRTELATRARALLANIRGLGDDGADGDSELHDDVEVLQPLGLFSRPTIRRTLEGFLFDLGEELVAAFLTDKGAGVLSDVEEGETRVYAAADGSCRVRLRADGSVDVEAKSGANVRITVAGGGSVVLNGGTLEVARKTDAVSPGAAMATWMSQVATAINTLAPGSVTPPSPPEFATITGGNSTVKA